MIPDNVTLIVKAPNQQIDDQNIECQSSWTVKQLKGHLSEVYPSKPGADEQKIIYSGQLLDDNTVLKDVLRTYESQIAHTMHLVCTPNRNMDPPAPTPDGLRQRNVTDRAEPIQVTRPETRQNDQNHTVEMQNYLSSFVNNYGRVPPYPNNYNNFGGRFLPVNPNDPASYANHMMMMQQAYLQYMQQYANMWQATNNAVPAAPPAPEAPAAPEPAPAPEEEDAPRDWLDHLYAASRIAILFSLVYLYGSPARLLLVLLLAVAGYLHQIGFFRDLHVNQAPRPQPVPRPAAGLDPAPAAANQAPVDQAPVNQAPVNPPVNQAPVNEPAAQVNAEAVNAAPQVNHASETTPPEDNQQSLLAVTWMIFTTFFASLIPDTN
ncbi:homocysteine-responsive endoplasmic reticulum-resident ubiquitin-like domain member 2 protein [Leguminivora glycinivorella]|uniref:homocysteine-responsive endoplasmic reticulum-resident ubiquitin-like domain member 2 protein n=1 Tax=Leguminivora glycinivorella TaxID=1035111 RepID=UPI00200BE5E4|nr:homocysteine-responsive endoplasmic reticulum-resident ubiquitin-like domain member 2 protein [Leguminivora glycinivorella]